MSKREWLRDNQRSKVYAWEKDAAPAVELPYLDLKTDVREIVDSVGRIYGIRRPIRLLDGRGRSNACYKPGHYAIALPRWARTMPCVLHEAAHWVTHFLYVGKPYEAHGREFVAVYMYLLNRFHGVTIEHLARTANAAGVDFASVDAHKPYGGLAKWS